MDTLLPSEIARLVLGYLEEEKCTEAAKCFLYSSAHLSEIRFVAQKGKKYPTKVNGVSLKEVLEEYCLVHSIVEECLSSMTEQPTGGMIECLRYLVRACQPVQVNINLLQGLNTSQNKSENSESVSSRPRSRKSTLTSGQIIETLDIASEPCSGFPQVLKDKSSVQGHSAVNKSDQSYLQQPPAHGTVSETQLNQSCNSGEPCSPLNRLDGRCQEGNSHSSQSDQIAHHGTSETPAPNSFQNDMVETYHDSSPLVTTPQSSDSSHAAANSQQTAHVSDGKDIEAAVETAAKAKSHQQIHVSVANPTITSVQSAASAKSQQPAHLSVAKSTNVVIQGVTTEISPKPIHGSAVSPLKIVPVASKAESEQAVYPRFMVVQTVPPENSQQGMNSSTVTPTYMVVQAITTPNSQQATHSSAVNSSIISVPAVPKVNSHQTVCLSAANPTNVIVPADPSAIAQQTIYSSAADSNQIAVPAATVLDPEPVVHLSGTNNMVTLTDDLESQPQADINFQQSAPEVEDREFSKPKGSVKYVTECYGSSIVIMDEDPDSSELCLPITGNLFNTNSQDDDPKKIKEVVEQRILPQLPDKICENEVMIEKLVENINRVRASSKQCGGNESHLLQEGPSGLDVATVHSIINKTEEDPCFDDFLKELLQAPGLGIPSSSEESQENIVSNTEKKKRVRKKKSGSGKVKEPCENTLPNISDEVSSPSKQQPEKDLITGNDLAMPEGVTPVKATSDCETMTPMTKLLKSIISPSGELHFESSQFANFLDLPGSATKLTEQDLQTSTSAITQVLQPQPTNISDGTIHQIIQQASVPIVFCDSTQQAAQYRSEDGVSTIFTGEIQVMPDHSFKPILPKLSQGATLPPDISDGKPKKRYSRCKTRGGRKASGQTHSDRSIGTTKSCEKNTVTLYAADGENEASYSASSDVPIAVSDVSDKSAEVPPSDIIVEVIEEIEENPVQEKNCEEVLSQPEALHAIQDAKEELSNKKEGVDVSLLPLNCSGVRNTPGVSGLARATDKRMSFSTPRRRLSHIRALDFNTPPKENDQSLRRANTSPKNMSTNAISPHTAGKSIIPSARGVLFKLPGNESQRNSKAKAHLFKSPDYPMSLSSGFRNPSTAVTSTPAETSRSVAHSPLSEPSGTWDKVGGVTAILDPDMSPVKRAEPQCKKEVFKSWDADLRSALGEGICQAPPASRKRRNSQPAEKTVQKKSKQEKKESDKPNDEILEKTQDMTPNISTESDTEMAKLIENNLLNSSSVVGSPPQKPRNPPSPKPKGSSPNSKVTSPKSKVSSSKSKVSSPKSKVSSPKSKAASPKSKVSSPKPKVSSPKSKVSSPKSKASSSKSKVSSRKPKGPPPKPAVSPSKSVVTSRRTRASSLKLKVTSSKTKKSDGVQNTVKDDLPVVSEEAEGEPLNTREAETASISQQSNLSKGTLDDPPINEESSKTPTILKTSDVDKDPKPKMVETPVPEPSAVQGKIQQAQAVWKESLFDTPTKGEVASMVPQTPCFMDSSMTSKEDTPRTKIIKALPFPKLPSMETPTPAVPPTPTIHSAPHVSPSCPAYFQPGKSSPVCSIWQHSERPATDKDDELESILIQEASRMEASGMRENVKKLASRLKRKSGSASPARDEKGESDSDKGKQDQTGGSLNSSPVESSSGNVDKNSGCARIRYYHQKEIMIEVKEKIISIDSTACRTKLRSSGDETDVCVSISPNKDSVDLWENTSDYEVISGQEVPAMLPSKCNKSFSSSKRSHSSSSQPLTNIGGNEIEEALDILHGKNPVKKPLKLHSKQKNSPKKLPQTPITLALESPKQKQAATSTSLDDNIQESHNQADNISMVTPVKGKSPKKRTPSSKKKLVSDVENRVTDNESSDSSDSDSTSDSSSDSSSSSSSSEEDSPVKEKIPPCEQNTPLENKVSEPLNCAHIGSEVVLPEGVLPEGVLPEEGLPEEGLPEEVLPEEVLPEEVLPEEVLPEEVLPEEVLPGEVHTSAESSIKDPTNGHGASTLLSINNSVKVSAPIQSQELEVSSEQTSPVVSRVVAPIIDDASSPPSGQRNQNLREKIKTADAQQKEESSVNRQLRSLLKTKDMGLCEKTASNRSAIPTGSSNILTELQQKRLRTLEHLKKNTTIRGKGSTGRVSVSTVNSSKRGCSKPAHIPDIQIVQESNNKQETKDNYSNKNIPKRERSKSEPEKNVCQEESKDSNVKRRSASDSAKDSDDDEEFKLHLSGDEKEESPPKSPTGSHDPIEKQVSDSHHGDPQSSSTPIESSKAVSVHSRFNLDLNSKLYAKQGLTSKSGKQFVSSKTSDELIKSLMEKGFKCTMPTLPSQRIKKIIPKLNTEEPQPSLPLKSEGNSREQVSSRKENSSTSQINPSTSVKKTSNDVGEDSNYGFDEEDEGASEVINTSTSKNRRDVFLTYRGLGPSRTKNDKLSTIRVMRIEMGGETPLYLKPTALFHLYDVAPKFKRSESGDRRRPQSDSDRKDGKTGKSDAKYSYDRDGRENRLRTQQDRSSGVRERRLTDDSRSRRNRSPSPRHRRTKDFSTDRSHQKDARRNQDYLSHSRSDSYPKRPVCETSHSRKCVESGSKTKSRKDLEEGEISDSDLEPKTIGQKRRASSPEVLRSYKGRESRSLDARGGRGTKPSNKSPPQSQERRSMKRPSHAPQRRTSSQKNLEALEKGQREEDATSSSNEKKIRKRRKTPDARNHPGNSDTSDADMDLDETNFPMLGEDDLDDGISCQENNESLTLRRAPPRSVNAHKMKTPVRKGKRKLSSTPPTSDDNCTDSLSSVNTSAKRVGSSQQSKKAAKTSGQTSKPNESESVTDSTEILKNLDLESFLSKLHG